MANSFEDTVVDLLETHPFYAYLLLDLPRRYTKAIPTAAVALDNKKNVQLLVNLDFFNSRKKDEQKAIAIHELLHLVLRHLTRIGERDKHVWNLSADLSCNQYLPYVDPSWDIITIPKMEKELGIKIPPGETVEFYYDLLKPHIPPQMKICLSFGDDHSTWEELSDTEKEVIEKVFEASLKDAMQKSRGTIPGNLASIIDKILNPELPWEVILRKFLQFSRKTTRMFTKKRFSKRFDTVPGEKNTDQFKLVVGIDTSGSVSDGDLQKFANELVGISRFPNTEIIVAEADADIQQVYKFKGKFTGKEFKGRGGTCFDPVVQFASKEKADALIYLTDGGAPDPNIPRNLRVLWVLTKDHEPKKGRCVVMKE